MKRWAVAVPLLAVAAYVAGVLVWLGTDRRLDRDAFEPYSTANTSPSGLSLAYSYLRDRRAEAAGGPAVGRLTAPMEVVGLPADAVLFRIAPADRRGMLFLEAFPTGDGEDGDGGKEKEGAGQDGTGGEAKREPAGGNGSERPRDGTEAPPAGSRREPHRRRPRPEPADLLTPGERAWVEGGGRLVLAVSGSYGPVTAAPATGDVRKVFPLWPGVRSVAPPAVRALGGWPLRLAHAVLVAGEDVVACRLLLGAGEVILLGCPEIFRNSALGNADHLALLEALAGSGRPVMFDEFVHGLQHDVRLLELLRRWGLGPFVVLAALAAAAALWRAAARLGPPDEAYEDTRREAVDFVDSVARLYRRALPRRQALEQYRLGFTRAVAARTGLRGAALDARVDELTGGLEIPAPARGDIPHAQFNRSLKTLNDAYGRLEHEQHRRDR